MTENPNPRRPISGKSGVVQVGFWILLLAAAAALIAWSGQRSANKEAADRVDTIRRAIEVQALGLRGAAANFNYLPFTVAQHPDVVQALAAPNDVSPQQRLNHYLEEVNRRAGSDTLYVMDLDGKTLAASNWQAPQSFVGHDYANRPYFIDARGGGSGLFYGIGTTTGIAGLFIAAPVRSAGHVVGVVTVKVSLRAIEAAWADARDPILLADARGILFLGSVVPWMFHATRPLAASDLERIRATRQYGPHGDFPPVPWAIDDTPDQAGYLVSSRLDGAARRFLAVDENLPELGWTLTVMTDYAPVILARNTTWALGSLGAALLLLGGLYTRLRQRRLAEQRAGQQERDQLQSRRLAEQREARTELEQRVQERTSELQQAHAFRKAMEDSLLVGMRARDMDGRIIYVNPALCEMTGYGATELIGALPPYPYWHPDDLDKHWDDNHATLHGQTEQTGFESRMRHRDGHDVSIIIYTAPLIDGYGRQTGWMSSVVDISEAKRAEARERLHEQQLQHAGRLASLGEMASSLAHELNQPLMALSTYAGVAQEYARRGEQGPLNASLADIKAQARRAADMVQNIRMSARLRTHGIEDCSVNALVTNVLALLKPEIRRQRARIKLTLQDGIHPVSGDRVLLEQVLVNLVVNALQAMVDTSPAQRVVEIETTVAGAYVNVLVADRGTGIAPDTAQRLFDPFFTTKPEGLGLGLNICRTIAESHRGRLSFENRPGGGATFIFCIPWTP
jgi:two-component system, LuxR family, sensor histidine kinase DctS